MLAFSPHIFSVLPMFLESRSVVGQRATMNQATTSKTALTIARTLHVAKCLFFCNINCRVKSRHTEVRLRMSLDGDLNIVKKT